MIIIDIIKWAIFVLVLVYAIVMTYLIFVKLKKKNTSKSIDSNTLCNKYIEELSTVNKQLSTCKTIGGLKCPADSDKLETCNTKLGTCTTTLTVDAARVAQYQKDDASFKTVNTDLKKTVSDLSNKYNQCDTEKKKLNTSYSIAVKDQEAKLTRLQGQTLKEFLNTNNATQGNGVWLSHNVKSSADADQMCKLAGYTGALSQNDYTTQSGTTWRHGDSWWGPSTKQTVSGKGYINYGYLTKNGNWSFAGYRAEGSSSLPPVCKI